MDNFQGCLEMNTLYVTDKLSEITLIGEFPGHELGRFLESSSKTFTKITNFTL